MNKIKLSAKQDLFYKIVVLAGMQLGLPAREGLVVLQAMVNDMTEIFAEQDAEKALFDEKVDSKIH